MSIHFINKVKLSSCDITQLKVDAIVNAGKFSLVLFAE